MSNRRSPAGLPVTFLGQEVKVGDVVAYPVRVGSNLWMTVAVVEAVELDAPVKQNGPPWSSRKDVAYVRPTRSSREQQPSGRRTTVRIENLVKVT